MSGKTRSWLEVVLDILMFIGITIVVFGVLFICLRRPDWKTINTRKVTAHSSLAWTISDRYKPEGMDTWAYIDEIRRLNPKGIHRGETVIIPICEVER